MNTIKRAGIVVAAVLCLTSAVGAQSSQGTVTPTPNAVGPVFFAGGEYSRIATLMLDAGVIFPLGDQTFKTTDVERGVKGLEVAASASYGGFQFATGYSVVTKQDTGLAYAANLRGVVGKLGPEGLQPHTTYVGVDAGYTFAFVRGSLGVAYRIRGESNHTPWMFAPTIGIMIPFGPRW